MSLRTIRETRRQLQQAEDPDPLDASDFDMDVYAEEGTYWGAVLGYNPYPHEEA